MLYLNTEVDGRVGLAALSALPNCAANDGRDDALPRVPVAGSKDWLSSVVEVGKQEATRRENAMEEMDGNAHSDGDGSSEESGAFFAVDLECVLHKYRRWHECFPRVKPFYAVKCNPNREVVRLLAMAPGCGFDCASPAEIDQVLACGVDPSRIIYANPCKDVVALEHALNANVRTMTFDSKEELYKIRGVLDARTKKNEVPPSDDVGVQMVLRLRVPDSYSDCPLGEKYGATEDSCSQLISLAVELRLPLVGISFHCGSGCQNAQAYPEALAVAKTVFDIAERQGVRLTLLDIGGGYPGWDGSEYVYQRTPAGTTTTTTAGTSEASSAATATVQANDASASGGEGTPPSTPLSLAEIASATLPVLDELFPPSSGIQVIAEPGRYFVEASHLLFARIYAKRTLFLASQAGSPSANEEPPDETRTKKTAYYIDEGLNGCFKDRLLCGVNFEPCPVSLTTATARGRGRGGGPTASPEDEQHEQQHQQHQQEQRQDEVGGGHGDEATATVSTAAPAATACEAFERECRDEDCEEDALVMGPSGLPADVVARKRLPKSLKPGDWLYFSQMGAYTASIATVASSAALAGSYLYFASVPAARAASAPAVPGRGDGGAAQEAVSEVGTVGEGESIGGG